MHALLLSITKYSYPGIFIALGLGILGLPIPDETLLAFVGFLIFQGKLAYFYAIAVAFVGTSCGITVGYLIGRILGIRFIRRYASRIHLNPDHIHSAEKFYNRYGKFTLLIGYFVPGIRHLTAIFAGTSLMPYRIFALFTYGGALIWTVTFISLGYVLGEQWKHVSAYSYHYIIPMVLVVCIILTVVMYLRNSNGK
ncbi:MAG TPA: DedA family protein [Syntrophales bacterium]|nr:DedA family protein [Syntrophales bacterium]